MFSAVESGFTVARAMKFMFLRQVESVIKTCYLFMNCLW